MSRYKDNNWKLPEHKVQTWEQAGIAILMDIRDELKQLNRLIGCPNLLDILHTLKRISHNIASRSDDREES